MDYVLRIFADSVSITSMLNEATGAMQDTVRQCNESAISTFQKLSWMQGGCFEMRRERKQVAAAAQASSSNKSGAPGHSGTHSLVRLAAEQLLSYASAVLSAVAVAAFGIAGRSTFRAACERSEAAEKLGEEKLARLRTAAVRAGKRRKTTQALVAEEAAAKLDAGERHGTEFKRKAAETLELAREGSEVEKAAVMAQLAVQSYWDKGFETRSHLWVEVCAVLPDVARQLHDALPGGVPAPKTKGAITKATAAWVRKAKGGETGSVNWEESRACGDVRAGVAAGKKSAMELLKAGVPTIK